MRVKDNLNVAGRDQASVAAADMRVLLMEQL